MSEERKAKAEREPSPSPAVGGLQAFQKPSNQAATARRASPAPAQPAEPASRPRRLGRVYRQRRVIEGKRVACGPWWVDFGHDQRRYRMPAQDARTEKQAWDFLEAQRQAVRQGARLDLERARWEHVAARVLHRYESKGTRPRTLARWRQALAHLDAFFGGARAGDIQGRLDAYVVARRDEGAKPGTIRLEVGVLAHAFKVARLPRLELPAIEVRNVRLGFLEEPEVRRIAQHLPAALQPVVWFGFYSGWRKSEILQLAWRNVDLAGGFVRLDPGTTKSGQGRSLPFSVHPALGPLLQEQREATAALEHATGQIIANVFHRGGAPIRDLDDAWRTACKTAALPGRLFHDLRRSAALHLRRLGLSESDIMEACGWETRSMFQRYAIKDETGLAERLQRARDGSITAALRQTGAPRQPKETT